MLKLNIKGDTIVEVLISLAVLSIAFATSYSIANRALILSQNSQEHTLALNYLDAQLEALRYATSQPSLSGIPLSEFTHSPTLNAPAFCLSPGSLSNPLIYVPFSNVPSFNPSDYPTGCKLAGSGFDYYISISPGSPNEFNASIWWPGLGNLGNQTEELSYRVYP